MSVVWNNSFKNDNVLGDLNCNHNIFPKIRGTLALDAWKKIIRKLVESSKQPVVMASPNGHWKKVQTPNQCWVVIRNRDNSLSVIYPGVYSLSWQGWEVKTVHNQGLKEPLELSPHKESQA